jgi:glycosyltransferase involved in cell wall biosynthesis
MKIAIMGIRGIPANYGGFETFAEELSTHLAQRGHEVTVYGRSNNIQYAGKTYRGVRLVILPTIRHKYFDTVAHTFLCVVHSLTQKYDAILVCNSANAIFSWVPRLKGMPVALNVDGLEWKRAKWNALGKIFYRLSEWLATFCVNEIVTDAREIERYYMKRFHKRSTYIPYGAPIEGVATDDTLRRFNLQPKGYVLYVSRFEPENNPHRVVKAFEEVKTDLNLVMVGDAPYSNHFIQDLKSTKDPRIIFTGYVFGQGYRELQSNAYLYIQSTEVGGTHPALLEGMGHGNCVLANDVPEHREVLGDAGFFFKLGQNGDLRDKMQFLLDHPRLVEETGRKAQARIREHYTWDRITDGYEQLFMHMARLRS